MFAVPGGEERVLCVCDLSTQCDEFVRDVDTGEEDAETDDNEYVIFLRNVSPLPTYHLDVCSANRGTRRRG